ncbi:MAG: hypothetical protein AB8I08_29690 [Sandaracinaceae bacterium]
MTDDATWKNCSSCRKPIGFDTIHYLCSVSTCNRKRTAMFFCSVECWDAHDAGARHRSSWAEEKRSPKAP